MLLTSLDFLTPGQPWPPEDEKERLQTYEANRKLFEGKHAEVFKDWVRLLREDQRATLELILNWNKRLSTLWADLLLGEPPKITAGDQQEAAERIVIGNKLMLSSYEVALDVSRFGDGLFKVRSDGSRVYIEGQTPLVWFPVCRSDNVKDITAHVLAWTYETVGSATIGPIKVGTKKRKYLKAEIHERGRISTRIYEITNEKVGAMVEEEQVQETGIGDFLIVQVPNLITTDRATGLDDYSDLESIVQEIEVRVAQISRILDKHSDPNMYGPESALEIDPVTGKTTFRAGGKYFPVSEGEANPGYVVWDGQLDAAFKQIELLVEQLYILSETSAAAFGQLKSGLVESGSALRRLMMAPLAKVNRIRMRFDPALKKVLMLASELEVAQRVSDAVRIEEIHIDWRDGLPEDPKEQADIEATRKTAGLTSLESSLRRLDGLEGDALQEEVNRIKADQPAPAPPGERPRITLPGTAGGQGGGE